MNRFFSSLILSTAITLGFSASAAAERKVDFDQGPNAADALRDARTAAHQRAGNEGAMRAMSPLIPRIRQTSSAMKAQTRGSIFGPFQPLVAGSRPYASAQELIGPIKALPPKVQAPLNQAWADIESIRSDLLSQAQSLDAEDASLYDDAVAINREAADLRKRADALNADIDNYNSQCAGQPANQYCTDWYNRLAAEKDQLTRDVDEHNKLVDAWNGRYNALAGKATTFKEKVSDWEATIGAFALQAAKALEDGGVTRVRLQAQTGSTVFASASMTKVGPVTLYEGYQLLGQVYDQLSQAERDNRVNAFARAKDFVARCSQTGGCHAPVEQPVFNDPTQKPWGPRIDITVFVGTAFADNPAINQKP